MKRTLKDIVADDTIYMHAKYYEKHAFQIPSSEDGGIVTYLNCPARYLNDYNNPYAEVSERIYLCWLSDAIPKMFGEEYHRGCAFCMRNLARGCCPNGFGNPLSIQEEVKKE